jgi:hypothetical protein
VPVTTAQRPAGAAVRAPKIVLLAAMDGVRRAAERGAAVRAFLAPALVAAGCARRAVEGDVAVYTFAPWATAIVFALGAAPIVAWIVLRRRLAKGLRGFFVVVSAVLLLLGVPALLRERIEVSAEGCRLWGGLWFNPTDHEIRFDDLHRIGIVTKRRAVDGESGTYLVFVHRDGTAESVSEGELVQRAREEILAAARARGVEVVDAR